MSKEVNMDPSDLLLSILTPTHNRALFLEKLLSSADSSVLPFRWEWVVSDNCSSDDTVEIIKKHSARLPLVGQRHDNPVSPLNNLYSAALRARGKFIVYLADDDYLLWDQLDSAIRLMCHDQSTDVLITPFLNSKGQYQTGPIPNRVISQGRHIELFLYLTDHFFFPEIGIWDREAYIRSFNFGACVDPSIAALGNVLKHKSVKFWDIPFYVFVEHSHSQFGIKIATEQPERYAAALEYVLGCNNQILSPKNYYDAYPRINSHLLKRLEIVFYIAMNIERYDLAVEIANRLRARGMVLKNEKIDKILELSHKQASKWNFSSLVCNAEKEFE